MQNENAGPIVKKNKSEREKMFLNHIFDKDPESRKYEDIFYCNNEINNSIKQKNIRLEYTNFPKKIHKSLLNTCKILRC